MNVNPPDERVPYPELQAITEIAYARAGWDGWVRKKLGVVKKQ